MICPHCGVGISLEFFNRFEMEDSQGQTCFIEADNCPECEGIIAQIVYDEEDEKGQIIYPKLVTRYISMEVSEPYRTDFKEASAILSISPKASAALSRRILQHILREEYNIKHKSLAQEIDEFIKNADVPSYVKDAVDAVRNIGNFAAHPLKDTNTGEIVEVESGEAQWLIDVLETLFDVTFVQPKKLEERKKQLNEKLKQIGKPPMKDS